MSSRVWWSLPTRRSRAELRTGAFVGVCCVGGSKRRRVGALLPVIGTALILVAGTVTDRGIAALLSVRSVVWIGDVSYSWYLWHWPPIVFTAALWPDNRWLPAIVAAATLIPAWLSFRFIEEPIRANRQIIGRRVVKLVLVCITVPVVASLGLLGANWWERQTTTVKTISDAARLHASETRDGCQSLDTRPCLWPAARPRGTIYLVGDSNAAQFAEPLAAVANREGYDLAVTAKSSCPFVDLIAAGTHIEDGPACHRFVTELVDTLRTKRPALVIVANSSTEYIENDGLTLTNPDTGVTAATPAAKAQLWGPGLEAVLKPLDVPTVLIHSIPHFGEWPWDWGPQTCPAIRMYTDSCPRATSAATMWNFSSSGRAMPKPRPSQRFPEFVPRISRTTCARPIRVRPTGICVGCTATPRTSVSMVRCSLKTASAS